MAYRITERDLRAAVNRLNRELGRSEVPVSCVEGKTIFTVGTFTLSFAYGGVSLHEIQTEGGGVRDVFSSGHIPKRDLYERIHGMLRGIEYAKEVREKGAD